MRKSVHMRNAMPKFRAAGWTVWWQSKHTYPHRYIHTNILSNLGIVIHKTKHFSRWLKTKGSKIMFWPSGKLPYDCQKIAKKLTYFPKNCQKISFFSKKIWKKFHFWQFFLKKCLVLAIFWQSNGNFPEGQDLKSC